VAEANDDVEAVLMFSDKLMKLGMLEDMEPEWDMNQIVEIGNDSKANHQVRRISF
jgi:hypothetical protein